MEKVASGKFLASRARADTSRANPTPATNKKSINQTVGAFLLLWCDLSFVLLGYEHGERCSLGSYCERVQWTMKRAKTRAVVEKIEGKRKPDNFFGLPQTGALAITQWDLNLIYKTLDFTFMV